MLDLRENYPVSINRSKVIKITDYQSSISTNITSRKKENIDFPSSNVLQFDLEDGSKISARPSGTEPKIKFYFSVNKRLNSIEEYGATKQQLEHKIEHIKSDLNLN